MPRTSIALAVIVAALVATSCAVRVPKFIRYPTLDGRPGDVRPERSAVCAFGDCKIDVEITEPGCKVAVDIDHLYVSFPKNIHWTIETSGYKFPPDGIVFKNGRTQFVCGPQTDTRFFCHDFNTQRGKFEYAVKVVRLADNQECVLDPFIYNQ